ncbi:MAG: GlsB/YeaQ/YmgE family stress response membrane protein [Dehalococcoidia bacterium]
MGLLTWILVGLVAGFIAKLILGGGDGAGLRGVVITTLLGVAGALVGGFVSVALGYGDVTGFNVRSLVIAVLGAIAVIVVYRAITSRQSGGRRGLI